MNIKKGDKILLVLAVFLLAAGLVFRIGFRGAAKAKRVNLVFTQLRESAWGEDGLNSLIEEYEKLHPEVKIRQEIRGYDEIRAISTDAAGEETAGPDLIAMEGRYLAEFIKAKTFSSLDSYLHSETPLEEWVLPLVSSMDVLFYNIDILKTAGFDRPPRNRAEFLLYAQTVSGGKRGADKQYGAALALGPAENRGMYRDVFSWIWASGALLTREGVPDTGSKQVADTLAFLAQLNREGLLAPKSFDATGPQRLDEFAAGKIAMMTGSVQDIARVRDRMKEGSFGVTLIPGPADYAGKPVFGLSVWYAGIRAGGKHPDEAWAFLLYLRENGVTIAEQIRAVPGSLPREGFIAPYIGSDPYYSKAWDMYEAADLVQELTGFPKVRELETSVREELVKLFAAALTTAQKRQGQP
ncbi:sugar ABC transporter substrate-binding protein [Spirochaetia bacterium]|nr:sugar ABC transporter substrate-binding protein [Spirochaetia bacterium]